MSENQKVLFGIKALKSWLGISKPTVYKLMAHGLPCETPWWSGLWIYA